jgi:hypothetical protein
MCTPTLEPSSEGTVGGRGGGGGYTRRSSSLTRQSHSYNLFTLRSSGVVTPLNSRRFDSVSLKYKTYCVV